MSYVLRGSVMNPTHVQGKSAYEVAVLNGFEGTESEWLESLKPVRGVDYWTEEDVAAIKAYIDSSSATARLTEVTIVASAWNEIDEGLFAQVVNIDGITQHSKVDLLPDVFQLAVFHNKDVTFVTENEDGVVTVYAIGEKPLMDYTMQAQITEVVV